MSISVRGRRVEARTKTLVAVFEGAVLKSLRPADGQTEFVQPRNQIPPLDLFFVNQQTLGYDKLGQCEVRALSDAAARVTLRGARSDLSLLIQIDQDTQDLCITPSGVSTRQGLVSVRWNIDFHREAALILPCVNGIAIDSSREFPGNDRFTWPCRWNAQFAICEASGHVAMIHSEDTNLKFKALSLQREDGCTTLGFESETVGPLWNNRTAGGIQWRLSVAKGTWKTAASRYRRRLDRVHGLKRKREGRPRWVDDVTLAVCWADARSEVLDALAKVHPPRRTLIHLSNWRTSKYDADYPDYTPSASARAYLKKARAMGFHVMPHFNYFSVYYDHPFYQEVRDFQIRSAYENEPQGWHWPPDTFEYTRMAYIHPGLGVWRRKLLDVVSTTCARLETPIAFIDQTLCTWNTDNGLVEGLNTVEGMWQLQEEFSSIHPALLLAGEGLNEVSFQRECFAQAHIHDGWGDIDDRHLRAVHPICSYLWQPHCRLIGYYHLRPTDQASQLGADIYTRMGAIPTIMTSNPKEIEARTPPIDQILEQAASLE